jgi:hypothetical protein
MKLRERGLLRQAAGTGRAGSLHPLGIASYGPDETDHQSEAKRVTGFKTFHCYD